MRSAAILGALMFATTLIAPSALAGPEQMADADVQEPVQCQTDSCGIPDLCGNSWEIKGPYSGIIPIPPVRREQTLNKEERIHVFYANPLNVFSYFDAVATICGTLEEILKEVNFFTDKVLQCADSGITEPEEMEECFSL